MIAGVVSRVKIMAALDIAEKRVPQDGRVSLTVDGHAIDTRVVTMPRVDGEGIVMRILDKSQALIGLHSLGMSEVSEDLFEDAFRRAYGAVLVTGPTGSGKSTTLYAALNEINEPGPQHHHDRGPGGVSAGGDQPAAGERQGRA